MVVCFLVLQQLMQAAAENYYNNGADEIAFLNITAFRKPVLADQPMLQVLEAASKNIFVPLCVGGGIQDYEDAEGNCYTALDVATCLFRAGADKISIGSAVRVPHVLVFSFQQQQH